jgi:hypothetical protein
MTEARPWATLPAVKQGWIVLAAVALLGLASCFGGDLNPIEDDPADARVSIEVVACDLDSVSGNVNLGFELTSDREYQTVLVNGRVTDGTGTVLDTSSASLLEVQPGETYRGEMVLVPVGEVEGRARVRGRARLRPGSHRRLTGAPRVPS